MMSFSILLLLLGTFWGSAFILRFHFSALLGKRIRLNGSDVYNNDVNTVHPASFLGLHTLVTCSTKFTHLSLVVWNLHTASNKYAEAWEQGYGLPSLVPRPCISLLPHSLGTRLTAYPHLEEEYLWSRYNNATNRASDNMQQCQLLLAFSTLITQVALIIIPPGNLLMISFLSSS